MAMEERYFTIMTSSKAAFDGRHALKTVADAAYYNGMLCAMEATTGSLIVSAGSPGGVFYDFMGDVELPTTDNLMTYKAGKLINHAADWFYAQVGKDLFVGGTIPAVGTKLYDGGSGLFGTNAVGQCIGKVMKNDVSLVTPAGTKTLAIIKCDFTTML